MNIAAAIALFASSFTFASTLPSAAAEEPSYSDLLQIIEQNQLRIQNNEMAIASL